MSWKLTTTADEDGLATALAPSHLAAGPYKVWGRQIVKGKEGPWSGPFMIDVLPPVRRFEPMYWHINMPMTISASIVTTGPDSVRLHAILRKKNDIVGMKWSSKDELDHLQIGYLQSNNYVDCILETDFALTGVSDIVMTVKDDEGEDYYVRLANYQTSGDAEGGHVRLNFAGSPVFGGYNIDDAEERTSIPWDRIVEFSIGLAPPDYDKDDDTPLEEPLEVSIELSNISVTGGNAYVPRRSSGPPATALRMCDGYDDSYNMCPERIVQALSYLGYSGQYVIYIGASHLHDLVWDEDAESFQVNPAYPVALPVREWFADMFTRLVTAGFDPVISQSYEVLKEFCPAAWQQKDSTGAGAQTGWDPPSTLLSPCVPEAMDYLRDVALEVCAILDAAGGAIRYQIGEPWWWDGSYSGGGPCIYDAATEALYVSETGQAVPTPRLTTITAPVGIHGDYLDWCSDKLGGSTLWLRDQVKDAYPSVTTYVLLFTPQILSPLSEIVTRLNLPVSSWEYPAWDVLQLEDYDWIVTGEWDLHELTLGAGTDTLGYPLDAIQYFGGFNLLHETAGDVWPRIKTAIDGAFTWGIAEVCVWARPQVFRDGWLYPTGRMAPALGLSPDPGPPLIPVVFPTDLDTVRTSFGDVRLSFAPNQSTEGKTFTVEVMDVAGTTVTRSFALTSPATVGGRVFCDYPIEWNSVDFGFPPTYLVWRVKVGDSDPIGTAVLSIPVDNSVVVKAIGFGGQSNPLGHFTTLSGPTLGEGSAAAFRRAVADQLGLSWIEVMPVQMAWGSSAADKLADDDPGDGENHWWVLDEDEAGPRLAEAIGIIDGLGIPLEGIIWGQGENDASAMNPLSAPRMSTPERYKAATEAIFAALRDACGNPSLPIWWQTMGRGYWGDAPDPPEAGGEYYKAVRDVQIEITAEQAATYIGSWVPGCETIAGYVPEVGNPGWIHYTSEVYHATALELAAAVATPLDRLAQRPAWTYMTAPSPSPSVDGFDVTLSWPAGEDAVFVVVNLNVISGAVISTGYATGEDGTATWLYTGDEQEDVYEYPGGWVNVVIYEVQGGVRGPSKQLTFDPSTLPGYAAAPTGLTVAHGTGWDLVYTWDAEEGVTYVVINRDVTDNSVISSEEVEATGSTASWTFTGAAQIGIYEAPAANVYFDVQRLYAGLPGPAASKVQEIALLPGGVAAPTGLLAKYSPGTWDIVLSWGSVAGRTYRVTNRSVVDASIISVTDVLASGSAASWTFTETAQTDEYSSHASYVDMDVAEVWDDYAGPAATLLHKMPPILGTVAATAWADFSRGYYDLPGSHPAASGFVIRTGGVKRVTDGTGAVTSVASNVLAFDYSSGRRRLVMEGSATNLFVGSAAPAAAQNVTVTAQVYTLSFWGAGSVDLTNAHVHTISGGSGRTTYTFTPSPGTLTLTPSGSVARVQLEVGSIASSYIETTVAAATRVTDVGPWSAAATGEVSITACTVAYRGSVLSLSASQPIIGLNSVELARSAGGVLSTINIRTPGTPGSYIDVAGALPGNIGYCGAWDVSGTILSVNGSTPGTNAVSSTGSITSMWFGRSAGLNPGTRHEIDEIAVWPIKGGSSDVQAQAHVWS